MQKTSNTKPKQQKNIRLDYPVSLYFAFMPYVRYNLNLAKKHRY